MLHEEHQVIDRILQSVAEGLRMIQMHPEYSAHEASAAGGGVISALSNNFRINADIVEGLRLRMAAREDETFPIVNADVVFEAIKHGDETHQAWLSAALVAIFAGEAVPPAPIVVALFNGSVEQLLANLALDDGQSVELAVALYDACPAVQKFFDATTQPAAPVGEPIVSSVASPTSEANTAKAGKPGKEEKHVPVESK